MSPHKLNSSPQPPVFASDIINYVSLLLSYYGILTSRYHLLKLVLVLLFINAFWSFCSQCQFLLLQRELHHRLDVLITCSCGVNENLLLLMMWEWILRLLVWVFLLAVAIASSASCFFCFITGQSNVFKLYLSMAADLLKTCCCPWL